MLCECPNCQTFQKRECFCEDIEIARKMAARLCLNLEMPACKVHDDNPTPEPCRYNHGTGSICDCKPSAAVEAKIREIMKFLGVKDSVGNWHPSWLDTKLRELARLARGGK